MPVSGPSYEIIPCRAKPDGARPCEASEIRYARRVYLVARSLTERAHAKHLKYSMPEGYTLTREAYSVRLRCDRARPCKKRTIPKIPFWNSSLFLIRRISCLLNSYFESLLRLLLQPDEFLLSESLLKYLR